MPWRAQVSSKWTFLRERATGDADVGLSRVGRWVAVALLVQLLWILTLAANPGLHRWAHDRHDHHHGSDHEHGEHHCVVDLFSSGMLSAGKAPAVFVAPAFTTCVRVFPAPTESARAPQRRTGVLEHAPPAVS